MISSARVWIRTPDHRDCSRALYSLGPAVDQQEEENSDTKKLKGNEAKQSKTLDNFFGKKTEQSESTLKAGGHKKDEEKETVSSEDDGTCLSDEAEADVSDTEEEQDQPQSPLSVKENIKNKFLVDMPDDFYYFWEFCQKEEPSDPCEALMSALGFQLVGPFDILVGKHKNVSKNRRDRTPNFLRHWRYYYDPPEFLTVIRGDNKKQLHLGYFRDDPKELPVFVAANCAKDNGIITPRGENLFAAVKYYIDETLKSTEGATKKKLEHLSKSLVEFAKTKNCSLDLKTKNMKARDKKVVCKSFHGAGIVVPVDENDIGYREVPETPADLKKMFKKIVDSKSEKERDDNFEPLQELITFIQFANDECDYGEGLELGLDLFTYGGKTFHSTILHLLPMAYELLHRPEFGQIINAHLKNRIHSADLSELA
ncbi:histone PARylation factor 1-like isoform X2 [Gigantopelta aegis]|uniref:histone PARylation factor 1-like isoform X2 n=1 Tax=Gigantopelta aegis TaxID=1735272 RepID=UPI001B88D92E|nr:histone PARylation factor 1-like isoform X2 [Gigantopelta aegis]